MKFKVALGELIHMKIKGRVSAQIGVIGKKPCILLQASPSGDVAYQLKLNTMAHLREPCLPGNEHDTKTPLFSSQETS